MHQSIEAESPEFAAARKLLDAYGVATIEHKLAWRRLRGCLSADWSGRNEELAWAEAQRLEAHCALLGAAGRVSISEATEILAGIAVRRAEARRIASMEAIA